MLIVDSCNSSSSPARRRRRDLWIPAVVVALSIAAEVPAQEAARRGERAVEEIVVRARKRDELLVDIPVAVSALDAEALIGNQVTQLSEVQNFVPNLFVDEFNRSGSEGFRAAIRGVGPTEGGDRSVGLYVDDVFLPSVGGLVLNLVDIQQVEVLRGPQGTLFGKNTTAGAISVTTQKPDDNFEIGTFFRYGRFNTADARVVLNAPVGGIFEDIVYTRFSVATQQSDGYYKNTYLDRRLNDRESYSFLGSVRILPHDDVEIMLRGNYFNSRSNGGGAHCLVIEEDPALIVAESVINTLYGGNGQTGLQNFHDSCRASTPYTVESDTPGFRALEAYATWGTATWNVGDIGFLENVDLKLIGSWQEQSGKQREDADKTRFAATRLEASGGGDILQGEPALTRIINLEGQFNGQALDGALTYVTGAFFQRQEIGGGVFALNAFPGSAVAQLFNATTLTTSEQDNTDWAIFGQATYDVTDWLSLTAGLRYNSEQRDIDISVLNPFGQEVPPGGGVAVLNQNTGSSTFDSWTPMASVALRLPEEHLDTLKVDHLMTYFLYSRGFTAGGFNNIIGSSEAAGLPFDPETLDNLELGLKTVTLDERLSANLAVFMGFWDDRQISQNRCFPAPNSLPQTVRVVTNAGKVETFGAELEVAARPIDHLNIEGSVGYVQAEIQNFQDFDPRVCSAVPTIDRSGENLNGFPELRTHLGVQYYWELPKLPIPEWMQGGLLPRLDWVYTGEEGGVFRIQEGKPPDYHLLNARLNYSFLDDRMYIAIWGKNLLDEKYFQTRGLIPLVGTHGILSLPLSPPATYGFEISFRFS